jgi:hypothetical protein
VEATFLQFLNKVFGNPSIMEGTGSKTIATLDNLIATDLDQVDGLGITGLKTDGGSSSNIQSVSQSSNTIKVQERIGLDKVIVRSNLVASTLAHSSFTIVMTYLDWTVSFADNLQPYPLSVLVQGNLCVLERDDSTRLVLRGVLRGVGMGEDILIGYGQKATI